MPFKDPSAIEYRSYETVYGPKTVLVLWRTATYSSQNTPFYPAKIRENPMQIHDLVRNYIPRPLRGSDNRIYDYHIAVSAPIPIFGEYSSNDMFRLQNRLNNRLHQGKVQLLTAFAERKQSLNMISKRVNQAVPLIRNYKRESTRLERGIKRAIRKPRKIRRLMKLLSDLRLEFSFGWAPIASDLHRLGNEIMPPILYADCRATLVSDQIIPTSVFGYTGGYIGKIKLTAFAQVSMSNPFSASASQLGLTDPLETAWELVPWSFAVDWILPIGDYLSQVNMFTGLKIVSSSLTIRQDGTFKHYYSLGGNTLPENSGTLKHYRRGPLPSPSLPRFVDSPFGSFTRTLNQLALLGQMVGKGKRR